MDPLPGPGESPAELHGPALADPLPAAREAVLEYFGSVLDGIVTIYNPHQNRDQNACNKDMS